LSSISPAEFDAIHADIDISSHTGLLKSTIALVGSSPVRGLTRSSQNLENGSSPGKTH